MITSVILFLLLAAVTVGSVVVLWYVVRARNKRLLLADGHGTSCETLDSIGISVLGSDVYEPAQVENLLTVEYARYEVVLVLDAQRRTAEFNALVTRYRMIRVDYSPSDELPVGGVRRLYRSRQRSYRRLVLIDRPQQSVESDFDVAAAVASYEYVLPVCCGRMLMPGAIERLVIEVGERPPETLSMVRVCIGEPAVLFNREAVVVAGGFGGHPGRGLLRRQVKWLWEPVFVARARARGPMRIVRVGAALLLLGGTVVAYRTGQGELLAVFLTAAFAWCCAEYAAQLLGNGERGPVLLFPGWRPARYGKIS